MHDRRPDERLRPPRPQRTPRGSAARAASACPPTSAANGAGRQEAVRERHVPAGSDPTPPPSPTTAPPRPPPRWRGTSGRTADRTRPDRPLPPTPPAAGPACRATRPRQTAGRAPRTNSSPVGPPRRRRASSRWRNSTSVSPAAAVAAAALCTAARHCIGQTSRPSGTVRRVAGRQPAQEGPMSGAIKPTSTTTGRAQAAATAHSDPPDSIVAHAAEVARHRRDRLVATDRADPPAPRQHGEAGGDRDRPRGARRRRPPRTPPRAPAHSRPASPAVSAGAPRAIGGRELHAPNVPTPSGERRPAQRRPPTREPHQPRKLPAGGVVAGGSRVPPASERRRREQ